MKITIRAVLLLVLSLITLASTIFAWVNISKRSEGIIKSDITDFTDVVTFFVRREGEIEFTEINSIEDMHEVFGNTHPGETYEFKFIIDNHTDTMRTILVEIRNIWTKYFQDIDNGYDLRDVFYIEEGKTYLSYYDKNDNFLRDESPHILPVLNENTVYKHNQELSKYRLNNIINPSNNNIILTAPIYVEVDEKAIVTFTLVYDPTTEDILYQDNQLNFYGIYIYGQ